SPCAGRTAVEDVAQSQQPAEYGLHMLRVQWLHPQACLPRRALPGSAGLDLSHLVSMAITIPQGYYGHVVPCNSLALQEGGIHAGVIDSDCLEEVKVAIHYTGTQPLRCAQGAQIAQQIGEQIGVPTIQETDSLWPTQQPAVACTP
uniref:dUTP diphosphatase n=1 Tax=Dromaius novaehollandiae TaxID=8790 RepID=A0A8C4JQ12_DRONO